MAKRHPNKHISKALKYAESQGWTFVASHGHAFGVIRCPIGIRGGCQMSILSTPRNPQNHARNIIAYVDDCPCFDIEDEGEE